MDICWLILFIYFCCGRGQPDGADNKQMRLEGRCWPGRVTDPLCLSVLLSLSLYLSWLSPSHKQSQLFIYVPSPRASMLGGWGVVFALVVWWRMGEWVGRLGRWIPCCSLTERAYALIGSLWLQHSHTRCTTLHSWVNLTHEFNYCVARKIFQIRTPGCYLYQCYTIARWRVYYPFNVAPYDPRAPWASGQVYVCCKTRKKAGGSWLPVPLSETN